MGTARQTVRGLMAASLVCAAGIATAEDRPSLGVVWPREGMSIPLGDDAEGVIGVVVESNFRLAAAGTCGDDQHCGHVHMKIDPEGESCNIPGRAYNSMNSDVGGNLIIARFGHCPSRTGEHVIGVLLADDHHQPILVGGQPVTALVRVRVE
jgi:hypothetical protein